MSDVVLELLAAGAHPAYPRLVPSLNSALHVSALKGDLASVRHLVSALITSLPMAPATQRQEPGPAEHYPKQQPVQLQQQQLQLQYQQQLQQLQNAQPQQRQANCGIPEVSPSVMTGRMAQGTAAAPRTAPAVDLLNANGSTPLLYSCGAGHLGVAAVLLKAGANPGHPNGDGVTPFMAAASGGHSHVLQLLIRTLREREQGSKGEGEGRPRWLQAPPSESVLDVVQGRGDEPVQMTEKNAEMADLGGCGGSIAAAAGTVALPHLVADVTAAADVHGSTALHYAARRGCSKCLAMLLEAVAPVVASTAAATAATPTAPCSPAEGGTTMTTSMLCRTLLCARNHGGRDVLAEARLSGDEATLQVVESWLHAPPVGAQSMEPPTTNPLTNKQRISSIKACASTVAANHARGSGKKARGGDGDCNGGDGGDRKKAVSPATSDSSYPESRFISGSFSALDPRAAEVAPSDGGGGDRDSAQADNGTDVGGEFNG
ncbi:hypothetical protein Vafri_18509, partial [Volvox africanus]